VHCQERPRRQTLIFTALTHTVDGQEEEEKRPQKGKDQMLQKLQGEGWEDVQELPKALETSSWSELHALR
jgi:hypothetical protein